MTVPRAAILLAAVVGAAGPALPQAPAAPQGRPPGAERIPETPRDYLGAAQPLDSRDTAAAVSRARTLLDAGEWGRGFAALDELLESTVSARRAKKATSTAPAPAAQPQGMAERNIILGAVPAGMAAPAQELEIEPGEEVLSLDGIRFLPVTAAVRALLLDVPPEGRTVYESTYGAPAREALEKARGLDASKAPAELRRIAERWPIAAAAAAARELHAARLLAAGRPQEAARALEARLELPASPAESAAALAQLAMAWEPAGSPASADRALARLLREQPDATLLVRGEEVAARDLSGHDLFRTLRERAKAPGPGEAAWTSEGGSFHHGSAPVALDRMPPLGSQAAWIHPPPVPGVRSRSGNERQAMPQPAAPPRHAVSLGRAVYLRSATDVLALDAWTGKTLWQASPSDLPEAASVQQGVRLLRLGRIRQYSDSFAPAGLSLSLVPPGPSRQALVIGIDRPPTVEQETSGAVRYAGNALVAYSAGTGKLVWKAELPSISGDEDDVTKGLAFIGPPVAAGEVLVAPASGGEALHAVGLTLRGKVLWKRRLFAWSLQAQGVFIAPGPPFAAADGAVGIAGGHGLACALDASTGEVLWTSRYRSGLRSENRVIHHHPGVRYSSPILIPSGNEPLLIAAPPDTDTITAFRLRTGSIRWEKSPGRSGAFLIGAANGMAFAGSDRVHALGLDEGNTLWESEVLGGQVLSGVVGEGFLIVHAGGGNMARLDPLTGKVLAKLQVLDPRLPAFEPLQLVAAGHAGEPARLIGIGPGVAFAVEPQEASWVEIGGDVRPAEGGQGDRRLFERARLLRAEGRHADALQVLERLHAGLGTEEMRDRVRADIIAVSRAAAEKLEDPSFIEKLLENDLVDTPRGRADLRLLQAHIIEKRFSREGDARILEDAARIYLELARKESLVVSAPGGLVVDAGAYASEALRELRSKLPSDEARGRSTDPGAEESARASLAGKPDRRLLSRLALRRAHLEASAEAARRLVASISDTGEAAEASRFLLGSFPALADDPTLASAAARNVPAPVADTPAPGLAAALDARREKPMASRFVVSSEDAFMASTAPGSLPLPVLVAIAGTNVRLLDAEGRILLERPLPGYPDIADVKIHLASGAEEPAEANLGEEGLVLFTAAGLYAFRGIEEGAARAKEFRLAWMNGWSHPLASKASFARMGWHGGMPGGDLFMAPVWTASGMPLVLGRDWTLSGFDRRTGKHRFRIAAEDAAGKLGAPAGARVRGDRVEALARAPAGVALYSLPPEGAGGRTRPARAFGAGTGNARSQSTEQAGSAALAAGGLIALFEGQNLSAVETASGARLWAKEGGFAMIAFTTSDAVWLSETDGRLVARSLVTGRERRAIELPARGAVVDCLEQRDGEGRVAGRWLLVSRDGLSRNARPGYVPERTGTDLHLVRLDADGKKLSEVILHEGAVAYTGCRLAIGPGRALILWNGEGKEGKWYTRAVEAGPGGVSEVLSFEISGKGTGQSPRVAVLDGGLAVGNAGGFSWFAPAGEEPRGTDGEPGTKKADG